MKKVIALISTCLVAFAMLSSCVGNHIESPEDSNTDEQTEAKTVSVDINKYVIVRPDAATDAEKAAATAMRTGLSKKGITLKVSAASSSAEKSENGYEILIGNVVRSASRSVADELDILAVWVIRIIGNKIVITSRYDALIGKAVEYFLENYVIDGNTGTLSIPESTYSETYETVSLVKGGIQQYRIVIDADSPTPIIKRADSLAEYMGNATGGYVKVVADTTAAKNYSPETADILIGATCLAESESKLLTMDISSYSIEVCGNKLLVIGSTDIGTELALDALLDSLQTVISSDGKKDVALVYDSALNGNLEGYFLDIPFPNGVDYVGSVDCENNNMQFVWENASAERFEEYCSTVVERGFTVYFQNTLGENDCNKYVTYTGNGGMLHAAYDAYGRTIRVVTAPLADTELPPVDPKPYSKVSDENIGKVNNAALLSLTYDPSSNNGMSMVFTLDDGSYLIFDGGENEEHADILFDYLEKNNVHESGDIVIAGWVITHAHSDHYGALLEFANKYASRVAVEYIFANGYSEYAVSGIGTSDILTSVIQSYTAKFANKNTKVVKIHTGQKIKLRNAEIDVLLTHESFYPSMINDSNDTSTVCMVTVEGKKVLVTGDAQSQTCSRLVSSFGSSLNCYVFQVPHHGQGGLQNSLTDAANPTYAFYATGETGFTSYKQSSINNYLIQKLGTDNVFAAYGEHTVISLSE